jgi:uncharacterized protein
MASARGRHSTRRGACGTLNRFSNGRERLTKFLVIFLALLLAYWIFKSSRKPGGRGRPPQGSTGEDMVRCDQCGIHLPRSESITTRGNFYCSAEHQREHLKSD